MLKEFDDVRIKNSGLTGTIVDTSDKVQNGFFVQLDNIDLLAEQGKDTVVTCTEDELEKIN